MFGVSIFEAFGLGFLAKLLGELKYIFCSIIVYLANSTFYKYLTNIFNVVEENESIRYKYKKPVEIDWKAEFEKADRQREIEKWKEKYEKYEKNKEGIDKKTIALLILLLGGTITTYYYGPDLLNIFSPIYNLSKLIKRILRGGRDDDDDNNNTPRVGSVELHPDVRSISPDMLVYSSHKVAPTGPTSAPPAPPIPPTAPPYQPVPQVESILEVNPTIEVPPIPKTNQGPIGDIFDLIKSGKKLRKTETIDKTIPKGGRVVEGDTAVASSSKVTIDNTENISLTDQLLKKFDKLRPMITGDDSELEIPKSGDDWNESGQTTPTNLLDKGKGVDKSTMKDKFLKTIEKDSKIETTSPKISPALNAIKENFPNLSKETLEKLSTPEGIKNRKEIIASLSDNELSVNVTPSVELNELDKNKFDKILKETMHLDSNSVIAKIQKEIPNYNIDNYKYDFMKAIEQEINSATTEEERNRIKKDFTDFDLVEIQKSIGTSDSKVIKNILNENYTHNSLLNEIKNKTKKIDEIKKLKPDDTFELLKDLNSPENSELINPILFDNVDEAINKIIQENPTNTSKQILIEKLIQENPLHKNEILKFVNNSMNKAIDLIEDKLSESKLKKVRKILTREDLKDRETLNENISIDQIKIMKSINKSHSSFLDEIKNKKKSNFNQ